VKAPIRVSTDRWAKGSLVQIAERFTDDLDERLKAIWQAEARRPEASVDQMVVWLVFPLFDRSTPAADGPDPHVIRVSKRSWDFEFALPVDLDVVSLASEHDALRLAVAAFELAEAAGARRKLGDHMVWARHLMGLVTGEVSPSPPGGDVTVVVADDAVVEGERSAAAVALFAGDDWVWSEVDDRCPFGSDEGSDAVGEFREWRVEHPAGKVASFLGSYLRELDGPTLRKFVKGRPDRSWLRDETTQSDEFAWSAGVLAVVLGQFVDEGVVDHGLGEVLRAALDRLLVWDEVLSDLYPDGERVYRDHLQRLQVLAGQIPERPR
jgi:hypothetical protein